MARCRAAEKRDELATLHATTSSMLNGPGYHVSYAAVRRLLRCNGCAKPRAGLGQVEKINSVQHHVSTADSCRSCCTRETFSLVPEAAVSIRNKIIGPTRRSWDPPKEPS